MTDDSMALRREILERAKAVHSFIASYKSAYSLQLMPFEATGIMYFLDPDRFRAETVFNGARIITIRNGTKVQRYLPKRKEIWKYDLADLPQTQPINSGIADIRNAFFMIDEGIMTYEGGEQHADTLYHVFSGQGRNWAKQGLLDTRKGFSLRYQPKSLDIRIRLLVDAQTGLLHSLIGTDRADKQIFHMEYANVRTNIFLEEALFVMDQSTAAYKSIDITETLLASLNPDAAESPPSIN